MRRLQTLCEFLRTHREEIIAVWMQSVRELSPAQELPPAVLRNAMPIILERLAEHVASQQDTAPVAVAEAAREHAIDRLGHGFDLDQVVVEYGLLRAAILELWSQEASSSVEVAELRRLDATFDEAIRQSVVRYARARERLLRSLNRVAESALESADVTSFLMALLRTTLDGTESVGTCAVFLRDGNLLRLQAAVGLEEAIVGKFAVRMGESAAGVVAASGQPRAWTHAAGDPEIINPVIHETNVRALYAVPLIREGEVIAVAHMGSLAATEFSEEDKLLFRTMASRASSVIYKAQLLADLQRAEGAQRFLAETSRQLAESLQIDKTLAKIATLAVPAIADWCRVDVLENGRLRLASLAHVDPVSKALAEELDGAYPPDAETEEGIQQALRTRQAICGEITDEALVRRARDSRQLQLLRELKLQSYIIVPVVPRGGAFAAITLITSEGRRRYGGFDIEVAEELARRTATAIENAQLFAEAQRAIQARERILAVVSHDLRNYLNTLVLTTNLLEVRVPDSETAVKAPIRTMQRVLRAMSRLLGDLLDMASLHADRLSLELKQMPLTDLLDEAVQLYEPAAKGKGLKFAARFDVEDVTVYCDRGRMLQVIGNLLGNAIKFSRPGDSVLLTASLPDERHVLVAIGDSGPGIPAEDQGAIFEPFRTIQRSGQIGTGLGLYIARGIIERHGGSLWVRSDAGHGAEFFFTLPRAAAGVQ